MEDKNIENNTKKNLAVTIITIIEVFMIIMVAFLNTKIHIVLNIMGSIFFLFGFLFTTKTIRDKNSLVILYAHQLVGLVIISIISLKDFFNGGMLSDKPMNIYIYLAVVVLLFLTAYILQTINILKGKFENIKYFSTYLLTIYTIGFVMEAALPYVYKYIY